MKRYWQETETRLLDNCEFRHELIVSKCRTLPEVYTANEVGRPQRRVSMFSLWFMAL